MDGDEIRQRLAIAEFMLETAGTFNLVAPVLATLSYVVRLGDLNQRPQSTSQIAEMLEMNRHAARRGLKALEGMGWIVDRDGWTCAPRDARVVRSPHRWGQRVCILRRAGDRINGRPPRALKGGKVTDHEYKIFSEAFIAVMRPAFGPAPTRFDDAFILSACSISTWGRTPLGLGKISAACRLPRTSVSRRLQELVSRGWVEREGPAYVLAPTFDASVERRGRFERRLKGLQRALADLQAAEHASPLEAPTHKLCYNSDIYRLAEP